MKKVILYMASSIDGFIASSDGSVDWLDTEADIGDEYAFDSFLQGVDTIIMGRKSYEQTVSFGGWAFGNQHTFVFSKSTLQAQTPNTTIVTDPSPDFINTLKEENGKDIWLFGGGTLNHYFLENDLIDEIMLFVQPVVLGTGIGLFGNKAVDVKKFTRKKVVEFASGFNLLWYKR